MNNEIGEAKTPIEHILQSQLRMPGFGISSTRNQIMNRLQYALEHKWLSAVEVLQLCNELKVITDREESKRDADGKLDFGARSSLAKQLSSLNDRFEEMVLLKEQASPTIDGLRARRALLIQRVSKAESNGKLNSKKAQELNREIATVTTALSHNNISDEESKTITSSLSYMNKLIDEQISNTELASKAPQPAAGFLNKATFAAMSPSKIKARIMQNK
ncbi:MAG: hypothetical protein K2X81_00210 [Candidatus Obscuribacterales bacterium]|nr:hypothetical protein [Candidatus Obscuribacterales bacterium]